MNKPFQPGDVVVCVDDRPCRWECGSPFNLRRGHTYRVTEVFISIKGRPVLLLNGQPPLLSKYGRPIAGWRITRFRKIDDEVTEEFREQLAKLPVRERVS